MRKFLPTILILLLVVSCSKPTGQLVGTGNKGRFIDANPYGMVYIKGGSFIMGPMMNP